MASVLTYRPLPAGHQPSRSSGSAGGRTASFSSFPSRTPSDRSTFNSTASRPLPRRRRTRQNASESSTQSASPGPRGRNGAHHVVPARRLRSQYPSDSAERHVEYILVASFDIDKGPTMEHQYPGAISGDEGMLAELMLPDQAHVRSEDWTIFFLHKDSAQDEEQRQERRAERQRQREARREAMEQGAMDNPEYDDEDSDDDSEPEPDHGGPPLIYVLNLVNTKQDHTVKRGAVVKSMAICTRHPFLHIYKPLLLLALEEYLKTPFIQTLEHLYEAVNAMDLSLMPRLTVLEKQILQSSDLKDLFVEKFDQMINQRLEEEGDDIDSPRSPRRQISEGAVTKARYPLPRDTHEFETRVLYHSIPIPIKVPTAASPETVGDFSIIKLIQTFSAPHATAPQAFPLHPHLTTGGTHTHPIVVLINAVLTQKRIIFLGHNRPSGEVAAAVLGACALVSGSILRGFVRHAFPYTDLTKIDDLLNVPGFIAGVTNPAFSHHPEWWDLLCDIPTGRIKISPKIEQAPPTEGLQFFQQQHPSLAPGPTGVLPVSWFPPGHAPVSGSGMAAFDATGDSGFMEGITRAIAARHGEAALRAAFRSYIARFTRLAAAFEEAVYGASALYAGSTAEMDGDARGFGVTGHGCVWPDEQSRARELAAHAWRIEGWRNTRSYYALITDMAALWASSVEPPPPPPPPAAPTTNGRLAPPSQESEDMDMVAAAAAAAAAFAPDSDYSPSDYTSRGTSLYLVHGLDLSHQLDRLRTLHLSRAEAARIFRALDAAVHGYDAICQLLAAAPEREAGLFHVGLGLFHPDLLARQAAARLLSRVRAHPAGRHWWRGLGHFVRSTFTRIMSSIEQGDDGLGPERGLSLAPSQDDLRDHRDLTGPSSSSTATASATATAAADTVTAIALGNPSASAGTLASSTATITPADGGSSQWRSRSARRG